MCCSFSVLVGSVGTVPPLASLAWSDCSSSEVVSVGSLSSSGPFGCKSSSWWESVSIASSARGGGSCVGGSLELVAVEVVVFGGSKSSVQGLALTFNRLPGPAIRLNSVVCTDWSGVSANLSPDVFDSSGESIRIGLDDSRPVWSQVC